MTNGSPPRRSRRKFACEIKGCGKRPVMGFDFNLCSTHRRKMGEDMMAGQTLARCFWPGCREYGSGSLKICRPHQAIIVNSYADDRWVINKVAEMKALDEESAPKRERPTEGHVYFLLSDNLVKIGWTSDIDRRMKQYSPGARILAVMPGTKDDESRMHRKFSDLKGNRREWFTYHPRIMEEVERVVRDHGEPPRSLNEPMETKRITGPRLSNYIGGDRHPYGRISGGVLRG